MTLSGLTVAIGRVVDDSIVVLENIYRRAHLGEDVRKAALHGTREVSIAIFASTVTTVVVFLPIGLTGGLIGAFFLPFGLAVTYALGASFVVAITAIPVLARQFLHAHDAPGHEQVVEGGHIISDVEKRRGLLRIYTPLLEWALSHRALVLAIAGVLFIASMALLANRPRTFIPPIGEPQVTVDVSLPQGTGIIQNNEMVREMETYFQTLKDEGIVETYQSVIGSGGASLEALVGGGGLTRRSRRSQSR
ncbi:MAG: efflux RND transporter permease subunit [Anaerolineae bacterium]|nr:efflux RND transporter permease subunit [Anaerolineae bacterium]